MALYKAKEKASLLGISGSNCIIQKFDALKIEIVGKICGCHNQSSLKSEAVKVGQHC